MFGQRQENENVFYFKIKKNLKRFYIYAVISDTEAAYLTDTYSFFFLSDTFYILNGIFSKF